MPRRSVQWRTLVVAQSDGGHRFLPSGATAFCLTRATALLVLLPAIVGLLAPLVLAGLLLAFGFLRVRLALRRCCLAVRRRHRLLTLGGHLLGMLARLLHRFCFRWGPLALRHFLTARGGCRLLALNRCLLRVLHRRVIYWRRDKARCWPLCLLIRLLRRWCAGSHCRALLD